MKSKKNLKVLMFLAPATVFTLAYVSGLLILFVESFQTYIPGRISETFKFTWANYVEYFGQTRVYWNFLFETFYMAGAATIFTLLLAYPLAYKIARARSPRVRKILLGAVITSFFVNSIVKIFSWLAVLGNAGLLGTHEAVILGITYFSVTIAALVLVGPIKNVDPILEEAAMSLGAGKTTTFLRVTLPLSMPGVVAAILLTLSLGISAFIVPTFLGAGRVLMMSNLIYSRYSEIFDYPAGAALSVVLLITSFTLSYFVGSLLTRRIRGYK